MCQLSRKGVIINLLYGPGDNKETHFSDIRQIARIIDTLPKDWKFELKKNYLPNDITLVIQK